MSRRFLGLSVLLLIVTCAVFFYRHVQHAKPKGLVLSPSVAVPDLGRTGNPAGLGSTQVVTGKTPSSHAPIAHDVVASGSFGGGVGQFGRKRQAESSPEGPMAISAAPDGSVLIVDQVNRRVARYKDGRFVSQIPIGGDTVQDLAIGAEGLVVLLDRFVDRGILVYGPDGKLINDVPLPSKLDLGSLTGVFADEHGIYVEREHGQVTQVADANGNRIEGSKELSGRPSRDGQLVLSAALLERQSGQVLIRAHDRNRATLVFEKVVQLPTPVLHLVMLDSDRSGRIYFAAVTAIEDQAPPYALSDEALFAVRLGRDGSERGRLKLPPLHGSDESFRPVTVDDGGNLLVMQSSETGLSVVRYAFP